MDARCTKELSGRWQGHPRKGGYSHEYGTDYSPSL
jgi:hypothetical protein